MRSELEEDLNTSAPPQLQKQVCTEWHSWEVKFRKYIQCKLVSSTNLKLKICNILILS